MEFQIIATQPAQVSFEVPNCDNSSRDSIVVLKKCAGILGLSWGDRGFIWWPLKSKTFFHKSLKSISKPLQGIQFTSNAELLMHNHVRKETPLTEVLGCNYWRNLLLERLAIGETYWRRVGSWVVAFFLEKYCQCLWKHVGSSADR